VSEAEKIKKENKKRKRIVTVKGVCVAIVFALTVWAFTLGWFTESREDEMNGTEMSAENKGYKILTVGSDGRYDKFYSGYDATLSEDDLVSFKIKTDDDTTESCSGYETMGKYLTWRITDKANVRNYDTSANVNMSLKNSEYEIFPGTSGYIEFYILSEQAGELKLDFTTDITAYVLSGSPVKKNTDTEENNAEEETASDEKNITYELNSSDGTWVYTYTQNEDSTLANIVKGHIMLFEIDDNNKINWLTPDDGSFSVTVKTTADDVSNNIAVRKRIYWVWTGVFGQLVLDDDGLSSYEPSGGYSTVSGVLNKLLKNSGETAISAKSDIVSGSLKTVFSVNGGYFFPNAQSSEEDNETAVQSDEPEENVDGNADGNEDVDVGEPDGENGEEKGDEADGGSEDESDIITESDIENAVGGDVEATIYNKIKKAWNQGDQLIGKKVGFITIDLNVG
jgi:hypothetical protein